MRDNSYKVRPCVFYTLCVLITLSPAPVYAGFRDDFIDAKDTFLSAGKVVKNKVVSQISDIPTNDADIQNQKNLQPKETVKKLQKDLTSMGYKPGPIDGDFGPGTQEALKQFQKDFNHKETGSPDKRTMAQLHKAAALSPAERKLRQQTSPYTVTLQSAMVGGAAGVALALFSGGDTEDVIKYGLAGALIGGGAGMIVQNRVKEYKTEEAALDSLIDDAQKENTDMTRSIKTANQVIAADKEKITSIKKKLDAGEITKKEANEKMASVDSNTDYLKSTIKNMKSREEEWGKIADEVRKEDPQKADKINKETRQLKQKINSLETTVKDLVKQRKISIG